ncbi:HalOD1 output domain-containing protein [Natronobacterium texcoconense]|uniref:Halobacterial output domain-containing protein n=1 Tax=Natronobacterium texcoconense TaxID=1095778 RepID=A0A1H1GTJ5_NATTX|nr:HalOD1 output domain-containing protein [Natronobacterium texcoconense]SDR16497.1 hypothetical protein SAMN04489842_2602 [Natronobacterium texcoconense]
MILTRDGSTTVSVEYDRETNTYKATFDSTELAPSVAVVEAVAAIRGVEPLDVEPSLYEAIDPGALDALVRTQITSHRTGDCVVAFQYLEYEITVKSYGIIEIDPLETDEERAAGR